MGVNREKVKKRESSSAKTLEMIADDFQETCPRESTTNATRRSGKSSAQDEKGRNDEPGYIVHQYSGGCSTIV